MVINRQKQIEQFAKFSAYVLGRHPDEFGLVLDENGYIKIKEFIQAVMETDGWRHVRNSHINDTLLMLNNPLIEVDKNRIRAKDRSRLKNYSVCKNPPKLLYVCIKHKSYLSVLDNGVHPTAHASIICCKDREIAERIGKRRDNQPITLTVQVQKMLDQRLTFFHAGDMLYLTEYIPTDCFTGPPLPKEIPSIKRSAKKKDAIEAYKKQSQAGTFSLSMDKPTENKPSGKKFKGRKKEKDLSWKNNKKRLRKEKIKSWSDQ
ncbi:MAG: RNA 2'-phosphotransferase [Desulfobacteraceae bacterium]|nr:RNA 2'-phosphotransferase [Desulfobacteraceae bacterium]